MPVRESTPESLKALLPISIRRRISQWYQSVRALPRSLDILRASSPGNGQISVFYGHRLIPRRGEYVQGGLVKFQRMQQEFPNSPQRFNILYLVSSGMPAGVERMAWLARQKQWVRFLWNQNGVAYPGWHGPGWEAVNKPMAKLLHAADHVVYQSEFCKRSADLFLGERSGTWEILYNAVETKFLRSPQVEPDPHPLILLLGGTQYQRYRLDVALAVLANLVKKQQVDTRLLVTGQLSWASSMKAAREFASQRARKLGVEERVVFLGPYTQADAPSILGRAHILLHTKYNDPSPGIVVEAMACGLPVVYSSSGGVPELVGDEAGVGVQADLSWDRDMVPDPEDLTSAVLKIAENRKMFSEAARRRALERFDLAPWLKRHREIFEKLLA